MLSRRFALQLLASGLLTGCSPRPFLADSDRKLTLRHPSGGDMLTVAHRRGGIYDEEALRRIDAFFCDRRTGARRPIDPRLIDLLCDVRDRLGVAESTPITLVSGYRAPVTNAALARLNRGVAENSLHVRGMAADIVIPGASPERVAAAAAALGRGGYAAYARDGFTHLDTGPVRTWATG